MKTSTASREKLALGIIEADVSNRPDIKCDDLFLE